LAFEKERRYNNIMMAVGLIAAAAGLIILFTVSRTAGVLVLIIGVALLVISFSISNALYKIKMMEFFENRKKQNK